MERLQKQGEVSTRIRSKPRDFYGLSKFEAEKGLLEIARKTNMEVVIINPQ